MITIGSLYAMAPRALGRPAMHSRGAMELHFWLHTSGVLIYIIAMWIAGVMQGLMWRATEPGRHADLPLHRQPDRDPQPLRRALVRGLAHPGRHGGDGVEPLAHGRGGTRAPDQADPGADSRARPGAGAAPLPAVRLRRTTTWTAATSTSRRSRRTRLLLGVLIFVAVILRRPRRDHAAVHPGARGEPPPGVKPYDALRLAGKDVYVREGCYLCHSQMIRALRAETQRYGPASTRVGIRLRPPVPMGLEAHRARPRARRRQVLGRVAAPAPRRSARVRARVEHAGVSVARARASSTRADIAARMRDAAHARRPLHATTTSRRHRRPSRARPSSTRWSPTCRGSGAATRRAAAKEATK